jgi:M6 family metalloprotease-like protein
MERCCGRVILLCAALVAAAGAATTATGVASPRPAADCTAAQKAQRQAALSAYLRRMSAERRAYFKAHRGSKQRKAFVRRQQARLKALRAAAACSVPAPPVLSEGAPCAAQLAQNEQAASFERGVGYPFLNEGPTTRDGSLSAQTPVQALVIPVDFSDRPASADPRSLGNAATSQLGFFDDASYGRFSVTATVLGRWYRMPRPAGGYGSWFDPVGGARDLVADATAVADADVDFSKVDFVFLLTPNFPQSGNPAWSVFPGRGVVRDGKELRHATFLAEALTGGAQVAYVANHELTHSLGLPDVYYEIDPVAHVAAFDAVGIWDPMSEPGAHHFLAWHKWKLGWVDPAQVACVSSPGSVADTLSPLESKGGLKMVVAQTSPSTAYVVEARRRLGRDADICTEGVLVYTVDSQRGNARGSIFIKSASPGGTTSSSGCGAPFAARTAYEDAALKVEVLADRSDGSFDVRVTRK